MLENEIAPLNTVGFSYDYSGSIKAQLTGAYNFSCRKLEAHKSCVNALAFSSGDGRFLASGGDGM